MNQDIQRLADKLQDTEMSSRQYREHVMAKLRERVPFAAACCTTVDPLTLLSTGAIAEQGVEGIHSRLFEFEYLRKDYNKYELLVQSADRVVTLSGATEGELERSARYREVLAPAGFGDELRAALVAGGACWGFLTLFRSASSSVFLEQERALVASIAPVIAATLRSYTLSQPGEAVQALQGENGILVLSTGLIPITMNAAARDWLAKLRELEQLGSEELPSPIRAVCSRALAEVRQAEGEPSKAKICLRTADGNYISVIASLLEGPLGLSQLAVSFQPAKSSDILPLIAEAYALSAREKEIVGHLAKGLSTKELAGALHISAYTVQDHLKSIFFKTGVSSRRELIWRLFSQYSLD